MTHAPAPELRVSVRTSLGELARAWDRIASLSTRPSPFCRAWWVDHAAGATPAIVCCFEGGRLVGGAAFEVDTVGRFGLRLERVRCLGQGVLCPDHLDVVAEPTDGARVLAAVLGWLQRPGNRLVDLDGLAADGLLGQALAPHVIDRVAAPYADLGGPGGTGGVEAYLADRPGQVRSTVERSRRRLDRAGCTVERVPAEQRDAALSDLGRLHDRRWGESSEFLQAWDRFTGAARAATDDDLWVTVVRRPDGEVVATEWDVLTPTSACFYQSGRSEDREWRGAGSVLRAQVVTGAAASGRDEYDLLRGDEGYKQDWATGVRWLLRVRVGVGPVGRGVAAAARVWRTAAPSVERLRARVRGRRPTPVDR